MDNLLITDSSASMLAYSAKWRSRRARLAVADASRLPVPSDSVELLVASLGDPYNEAAFWSEACRVLAPGGRLVFTTPSHEWAWAFRQGDAASETAEFELSDGRRICVPSVIHPIAEQTSMIAAAGMIVARVTDVTLGDIDSARMSPKLLPQRSKSASCLTAFDVFKPRNGPPDD
jgi:SAM-dependent methyltransferase